MMNSLIKRRNDLSIFDDLFDGFFNRNGMPTSQGCMRTDIKEVEKGYELDIDVPGYGKDDIKISLDKGYLTVEAKIEEADETQNGHFIRRERFLGSAARSFYVGDDIAEKDIKAAYDKGILKLFVPKEGTNVKAKKYISIE
jgi:HSP20 family molecular chaperone IbpA